MVADASRVCTSGDITLPAAVSPEEIMTLLFPAVADKRHRARFEASPPAAADAMPCRLSRTLRVMQYTAVYRAAAQKSLEFMEFTMQRALFTGRRSEMNCCLFVYAACSLFTINEKKDVF